ncbi:MAG: Zn-dependent hydrolase [Gammaproteobacteria bacterium]|nr:Zn-dependent hydrolase [Gammaproteobacteria bacterium]
MNVRFVLFCFALLPALAAARQGDLRVDGDRLNGTMRHMHTFGENADGGSDRVAYSGHNRDALDYLAGLMRQAGLETVIDVAGNLVGRRPGRIDGYAPIVTGSHIDTVPNGGHYDGIVGVMSAIEVVRTLHETGRELDHPLEVVVWSNEEGGKTGSRSWAGAVLDRELELPSLGDRNLGEGIAFIGGAPDRLAGNERRPGDIAGYIELHVEQGAVLDRADIPIGVVQGIVGIKRWYITVRGFANHAGTTPMDQRQDALYAAALMIAEVRRTIAGEPGSQVGTVGRVDVSPGAPNVIPGEVMWSLEIRDLDMEKVTRLFGDIRAATTAIAEANNVTVEFDQYYESPAAPTDEGLQKLVRDSAAELGLASRDMPSGAGHDAQSMKGIAPLGMIFVPSRDGVSHAPSEYTSPAEITNGANVLLLTILGMDRLLQ